jgi:mRNA-degrading endonuclease YafQ of YafQ-DinJ toxin-antitoxin module
MMMKMRRKKTMKRRGKTIKKRRSQLSKLRKLLRLLLNKLPSHLRKRHQQRLLLQNLLQRKRRISMRKRLMKWRNP